MSKFKFAIAGCGRVATTHIEAILKQDEAEIYALCDVDAVCVENLQKKYNISKKYSDYQKLLEDDNVDVVVICTPSGMHADMAIEAAKRDKAVILEKPMAMNVVDAKRIIVEFERRNLALSVSLQNRFNKPIQFLKKMQSRLGRLNYINANIFWYREQSYYDNSWRGTQKMDGGVLMNQASHYVDIMTYFADKEVEEVSAFGATLAHKIETADTVTANIKFYDGTLGNLQVNVISYPENFEGSIVLLFEKATVKIGGLAMNEIVYYQGVGKDEADQVGIEEIKDVYGNGHVGLYNNFIGHLLRGEKLAVDGREGLKSLNLIEKISKAMK